MKSLTTLLEGGNVFKDKQGQPLTQRINQADVPTTIAYIENILGIEFPPERWLGSTGRKPTSGDLDLAVDLNEVDKDQLASALQKIVTSQNLDPREWVVKKGEVHFKTPIAGDPNNGYVQTDFMFFPNLEDLAIPVAIYTAVIIIMVLAAINRNSITNKDSYNNCLMGALLFMLSDMTLAVNKFFMQIDYAGLYLIVLYMAGQYLIMKGSISHLENRHINI